MSSDDTIWRTLQRAAEQTPQREFCTVDGAPTTLADLVTAAEQVAGSLAARGIRPGSRVAVMLPNCAEHVHLIFALLRAGAVYVPINMRVKGIGLQHVLARSRPELLVADDSVREPVEAAAVEAEWRGTMVWRRADGASMFHSAATENGPRPAAHPGSPGDLVGLSFTSGTTGPPKGVLVTDRMARGCADGVQAALGTRHGDRMLVWEPLYHIGGYQMLVLAVTRPVALTLLPRFSASSFWDEARASGATHIHYLGGVLQILLRQPPKPSDRRHQVRIAWGAGATAEAWRAFEARFGVQVREVYGMTEASSLSTANLDGRVGSIGRPLPGVNVHLVDDQHRPVPTGETGEICVRTADPGLLTAGYLNEPAATARLLPGDGWLYTGDAARADADGYLYFAGRLTDSLRVGGENVSAWEIETVVATHPAVTDCAVVGVPGELGEQDIKLFVQREAGQPITEAELVAWCAGRLARHQVPRYVSWVREFPRTPSLRIVKRRLPTGTEGCWDRLAHARTPWARHR